MKMLQFDVDEDLDKWGLGSHLVVLKALSDKLTAPPEPITREEAQRQRRNPLGRYDNLSRLPLSEDLLYDIYRDPAVAEVVLKYYTSL